MRKLAVVALIACVIGTTGCLALVRTVHSEVPTGTHLVHSVELISFSQSPTLLSIYDSTWDTGRFSLIRLWATTSPKRIPPAIATASAGSQNH